MLEATTQTRRAGAPATNRGGDGAVSLGSMSLGPPVPEAD